MNYFGRHGATGNELTMKNIYHIDLAELSQSDYTKFLDFYLRHKTASPFEIVEAWNKYAGKLSRHVFIKKEERSEEDGYIRASN